MKTIPFSFDLINEQQKATFEREGWGIFDSNGIPEACRIDDPLNFSDYKLIPLLEDDSAAKKLALHHGFLFLDEKNPYKVTDIIIYNTAIKVN